MDNESKYRELTFGDFAGSPANPNALAVGAWLCAKIAGADYAEYRKWGSRKTADYAMELAVQMARFGEAVPTADGWDITLAKPIRGQGVVRVRDPNTDDREPNGLPLGYHYNRALLERVVSGIPPSQIDALAIGDAAFILRTAFPELVSPFR